MMMLTDKMGEETKEVSIRVMPHEVRGKNSVKEVHCSGVRAVERSPPKGESCGMKTEEKK